ncbi:MAG: tripartite tricarboxylate transporter substrate binding protein [Burkholderiaceae bacterium]|nr:tripartite tricarboxylate transporter substrate binding protein [Burkholderiaceae bacterium]
MDRRCFIAGALLPVAGSLPLAVRAETADEWPTRTVKIVVPFGPGSTPDLLARLVADHLGKKLGQPFVVENRAGAGGNIGTQAVVRSAPDGYTIGLSITGPLVNNTLLYKKLPYDPFRDLAPVTLAAVQPSVLAVSPALGVNTAQELLALLKRNPGKYNYASLGSGTVAHLAMELIKARSGTYLVHIPYPSSPSAVSSIVAGDTQMGTLPPAAVMPLAQAGRLRALAVTTPERSPLMPELPTFKEVGIPGVEATAWLGFVVPSAVPAPLVARLNRELVGALREPAVSEKLRASYMTPAPGTQKEFADFMQSELARWKPIIERAGVTLD